MLTTTLHSIVFSIYPILFLYSFNIDRMYFSDALIPMLISLMIAILLLYSLNKIFKNPGKSSLITTAFLIFFFDFSAFKSILGQIFKESAVNGFFPVVIWLLFFFFTLSFILCKKFDYSPFISFLNLVCIVLIILNILLILDYQLFSSKSSLNHPKSKVFTESRENGNFPDIYYILVDGYAGNQVLKQLYSFDNKEFLGYLREKGFYIADDSFANYMQTALSLSCSLNFRYLDFLKEKFQDQNTAEPVMELIGKSTVVETLKSRGYKIVAFASGYATTELDSADLYFGKTLINREFYHILLNTTILSGIKFDLFDFIATQVKAHSQLINSIIEGLSKLEFSQNSEPAFVFAHLIMPHPPFIFEKDGKLKFQQPRGFHFGDGNHWGDPVDYRKQYIEQLQHLNNLLKKALSGILNNPRRKIIILQSDHGPGSMLNWENSKNSFLPERFSILNAFYFPDHDYSGLYKSISPVNSFRLVFNKIFQAGIELEEDKNFFSPWSFRYRFEYVTEFLKTQKKQLAD